MMHRKVCNTFLLVLYVNNVLSDDFHNESIADVLRNNGLTTMQLAKKYGLPIERHRVQTEDGYIIEMHRIPYGVTNINRINRPPVIIGHGAGGTSVEFLIMGHKSMVFRLVEAGYDVWIGNSRGTMWSRRHKTLSPRSKEFWMFSWDEIGVYDYSAEIDYAINVTGQQKVFFIGHSQGGTSFVAMGAVKPEMNDKVRLAILIGPTVFTKNNKNPLILVLSDNIEYVQALFNYLHLYEIPSGPVVRRFLTMLCRSPLSFLCAAYINLVMGYDNIQIDRRIIPTAISNLPGGLSVRQLVHYAQIFAAERFQKFDYGLEGNLQHYGSTQPPEYDISKVTAPVAVMYSKYDTFADVEDMKDLVEALPNCAFDYQIDKNMWNHVAFLVANDADKLVNDKIIEMMSQY